MAGAYDQVVEAFNQAYQYASSAKTQLTSFTAALDDAIFTPPTISTTWNALAPPSLPDVGAAPAMPTIAYNAPTGEPGALSLDEPTVVIDDFTAVEPTLNEITAPVVSYGTAPTVPAVGTVPLPDEPGITDPTAPTFLAMSTVSFAGIDLHEDFLTNLENIPTLSLTEPTPYTYALGPTYASALLTALKTKLQTRLAGGTGLDPAVEQAIWDRARDRETSLAQANIDDINRASEALGFDLPPGVLAAQLREAQRDYYGKVSGLSRDVAIKQADLEQENLRQTIEAGMQLEGKLVDYAYQMERLAFENAKAYADNAVQLYNAKVEAFKALLVGYQTYATVYRTLIEGELAKVEVYKAQLQGELAKAQINEALVNQYKAQIEANMARVEIYKVQVSAAQTLVDLEKTKISAAGEQIRGYIATVNAETAKVEAYKAQVEAENTKVTAYKVKADAFSAKVGAQAEKARAELGRYTALIQGHNALWEAYRTKVQVEGERIRALGIQSGALLDGYKAENAAVVAEAEMHTKVWETQIREYEASQQIALQTAKINSESIIATNAARLDAAKVGAQVYAQLTSSAYSMVHAQAGISGTAGMTVGYQYSGDVSSAVSPVTAI
jgi:hypothetical protein